MSEPEAPVVNALSFDIEDWFHLVEIDAVSDPATWPSLPTLVEEFTDKILEAVAAGKTRATFFVLGWVAERYPAIPRKIAAAGHELGTHSFWHRRVDLLTREEFREDIRRSIAVLEDNTGQRVRGFRAPSFSIVPGAEWALDELLDLGLDYDASLFPARRGHGGYDCPLGPHVFRNTPSGRSIPELPMSVMAFGPMRLPFSGGGYLRLLPPSIIRAGFSWTNRAGRPVVVYMHPRDFAPDGPIVPMPLYRRFKCTVGLSTSLDKLRMLLRTYRFDTCAAVLGLTP
ncbi:MAG TPA: polysaccharide deacetylase family protein [Candidatus Polarisedimenticolaceae bacterium]|nr:polysaccharide deacetylase family protein [Candidatus Polarisedimenticolaceae bacterium]